MAASSTLTLVEDYLRTVYRPDCDYIDGEILERNMGEKPHARLQKLLLRLFEGFEDDLCLEALPEQRLKISDARYRVPDVMLVAIPSPDLLIVRTAPRLCIEILSSQDRMSSIRERILDYAQMGVPVSWVIDPWRRTAYTAGTDGILHETDGVLTVPSTPISFSVSNLFAELDRLEERSTES